MTSYPIESPTNPETRLLCARKIEDFWHDLSEPLLHEFIFSHGVDRLSNSLKKYLKNKR